MKSDIIDRLRAYAEASDVLGAYTEANCAYDAIEEIEKLRKHRADLVNLMKLEIQSNYPDYLLQYPHNLRKLESELGALKEYED